MLQPAGADGHRGGTNCIHDEMDVTSEEHKTFPNNHKVSVASNAVALALYIIYFYLATK